MRRCASLATADAFPRAHARCARHAAVTARMLPAVSGRPVRDAPHTHAAHASRTGPRARPPRRACGAGRHMTIRGTRAAPIGSPRRRARVCVRRAAAGCPCAAGAGASVGSASCGTVTYATSCSSSRAPPVHLSAARAAHGSAPAGQTSPPPPRAAPIPGYNINVAACLRGLSRRRTGMVRNRTRDVDAQRAPARPRRLSSRRGREAVDP